MFNDVTAEEHMNSMHIDSVYTLVTKIAFMPISIDVIKESNNHCLPTFSIALWKSPFKWFLAPSNDPRSGFKCIDIMAQLCSMEFISG